MKLWCRKTERVGQPEQPPWNEELRATLHNMAGQDTHLLGDDLAKRIAYLTPLVANVNYMTTPDRGDVVMRFYDDGWLTVDPYTTRVARHDVPTVGRHMIGVGLFALWIPDPDRVGQIEFSELQRLWEFVSGTV